jgi:uncharacterized protein
MSSLVVRRLLVDFTAPFDRHWNGGDAFRSAFFNALSMSFPLGEQFFIDSVRNAVKTLPVEQQERFASEVQGFIGQEATHRRLHALYNEQLTRQGYVNRWESRIRVRLKKFEGVNVRHPLAVTAANEHFTAILAEHLLAHPQMLEGSEDRLRALWLWHSAEESEHRCTAFDVYQASGGDNRWRFRWMQLVTFFFLSDVLRQTARNLAHDGQLLRWSTWRSGARFLFSREHGLIRRSYSAWRDYFRPDFHPNQQGGERGIAWLAEHGSLFKPVTPTTQT